MKKALLTLAALVAAIAPLPTSASAAYNVLLAGGPEGNTIHIRLDLDGTAFVIESRVPLEVGGEVCEHPNGDVNVLACAASQIAGFEVNAGSGDDAVTVGGLVRVPVTMRGGPGNDLLVGGSGTDKLIGGMDDDRLIGEGAPDALLGGIGADVLRGGRGNDLLIGGPGFDELRGDLGRDVEVQEVRKPR